MNFPRGPGRPSQRSLPCGKYNIDQEVLCRWTDGLFYLARITKTDEKQGRCFVRFEDNSEYWVLFKDIQKGAIQGEICCCLCQGNSSASPNEIVLCDNCGLGYHQLCHNPPIEPGVLKPSVQFLCRLCVFATTVKRGGALKKGPNVKAFQAMKLSLPYKLHQLTWDPQHKSNSEQCYCYCGGPGDWFMKMLQCCRCRQWFHEACIQCLEHPLMFGDRFYVFVCSPCNLGREYIHRLDMAWPDVVHLALFSLTLQRGFKYYDLHEQLVPWIEEHWEALQLPKLELLSGRDMGPVVLNVLRSHKTRFSWGREIKKRSTLWGLRKRVPPAAPAFTLPTDGRVTDSIIGLLKGQDRQLRNSDAYQSESPVPLRFGKGRGRMDIDDSIVFRRSTPNGLHKVCKRPALENHSEPCTALIREGHDLEDLPSRRSSKRCRLDAAIPLPASWEGHHNPFRTDLERQEEEARLRSLQQCLQALNDSMAAQASVISVPTPPTSSSSSPRSGSEAGDDLKPPILHAEQISYRGQGRGRGRGRGRGQHRSSRDWDKPPSLSPSRIMRPRRTRMPVLSPLRGNAGQVGSSPLEKSQLHHKMTKYFGIPSQQHNGRQFRVLARRQTADGTVQILIHWLGAPR